jgi:hypothetical protein
MSGQVSFTANDFVHGRELTTLVDVSGAPSGADKTIAAREDTPYVFVVADFGFSDPTDAPADTLLAVKIDSLPANGSLVYSGTAITPAQISGGYFVLATDLAAGKLSFLPAVNANGSPYANFLFQVQDNGGTASGGADLNPAP